MVTGRMRIVVCLSGYEKKGMLTRRKRSGAMVAGRRSWDLMMGLSLVVFLRGVLRERVRKSVIKEQEE